MPKILWVSLVLATAQVGCGSDVDAAGDYSVSVTNRENGCNFQNWTEGDSSTNIPLTITQSGSAITGDVGGAAAVVLNLLLGSNVFTGEVSGDDLDMTIFGTNSATDGNCTYTVNAVFAGNLSGDLLTGEIRYTAATNDNPDCATIEGCVSRQELNGTRPP